MPTHDATALELVALVALDLGGGEMPTHAATLEGADSDAAA
jgi:hypothetical protein